MDFSSREGLITHLEALESQPHPGPSLPAFLDAVGKDGELPTELMLVTADETPRRPGFPSTFAPRNQAAVVRGNREPCRAIRNALD